MPKKLAKKARLNVGLSGWHREDVKAAIRKKGQTLTSLSLLNDFSPAYLRNALRRPLFEGEQIIARFLGIAPHVIWPDRYNVDGTSKIHRGNSAPTRRAA
jgi:Ner family transcriptional regulator